VLDEGRLTDNKGRVADFKNAIIIMTSNMGSSIIQEKFSDIDSDLETKTALAKTEVLALLKKSVRPEFLNRIDDIIMFTPLNQKDIFEIVKLQIAQLKKMVGKQEITLDATDEAIHYLGKKGYEPEFGARPVKRVIQKEVVNQLSKEILSGKIGTDSIILIDSFNDTLVFRNQSNLAENG
jgi:ATP-dependent Clp protease ATP-binding subunit ClpB